MLQQGLKNKCTDRLYMAMGSRTLVDICTSDLAGCSGVGYGVSSGTDKLDWHSYLPVYEEVLAPYRDSATRVLEVGIQGGGSIALWQRYFTQAMIVGVDATQNALTLGSKTKIYPDRANLLWLTDGYCPETIERLRSLSAPDGFDVVIDDGPHTVASQCYFSKFYSSLVKPGGLLVVEDINGMEAAQQILAQLPPFMDGHIRDLRDIKGRFDDIMVIATRITE